MRVFALTKRFGQRRSWLLVLQPLLSLSIFSVGMSDPKDGLIYMSVATLIMAFLSASQDVVVDAYRIEILDEREMEQGAGSSATQVGYRVGLLVSGAGAIAFSDYLKANKNLFIDSYSEILKSTFKLLRNFSALLIMLFGH